MKYRSSLICLILVTVSLHCARAGGVRFFDNTRITSHMLTSLCQDEDGYIWIGTEYGLNRFDGMVFTHYYTHNNTLVDNYIHDVFVDADGDVLIISGRTLQIYNRGTDLFDTVSFPEGHVPVLTDIAQLHDGRIVVANSKKGLWVVDKQAMAASPFDEVNSRVGTPESQSILVDSKGRLWICTNNDGILCCDISAGNAVHLHVETDRYTSKGVTGVVENSRGEILVLGMSALYRYDEEISGLVTLFTFPSSLSVRRLYVAGDDTLYTGSYGKGIYRLDVSAGKIVQALPEISDEYGLGNTGLYSLMEDADGNLWMAFNSKGLLLMTGHDQPFEYCPVSRIDPSCRNFLTLFSSLDDGGFIMGQSRGGLHRLDPEMGHVRTYLHGCNPVSACQVSEDKLWVGDFTRGLCILDLDSGDHRWILKQKRVTDFTKDAEGNIYVAVFNGPMLSYTPDGQTERKLGQATGGLTLHGRYLNTLFTDSRGMVWVGHHYGFDVYDPVSDSVLSVPCDDDLRKAVVYDIAESSDGIVWLGTSRGLFGYDSSRNEWHHKSADDGLMCEVICAVLPAEDSSLWLSTYRGLIHYTRHNDRFSYYLQGDGLEEVSYVRGVGTRSSSGKFYFGNNQGITSFYPEKVVSDAFIRPLKAAALIVGDRQVGIENDMVVLPHNQSSFSLRFSTMDFRNPQNTSFEYLLSSSKDGKWRRTSMGYSEVDFYNLSYGEHVLHVRAVCNETYSDVRHITIRILPPWYLTVWAKICYVLFTVMMLVFLWSSRHNRRLAEINEDKVRLFIDISHEIRSPLTLIKSPLESIMKNDYDEQTTKALRAIQRNTDRLLLLVNQILSIRKIEKGQMQLHYARTDMKEFVTDYVRDFEYSASGRNVDLTVRFENEPLEAYVDREHFGKVITNLISNAIKYVEDGGRVEVSVCAGSDRKTRGPMSQYLELVVADNGKGIDESQLKHVFERFYQVTQVRTSAQLGFGIGLNLSSQLVRLHGGTIAARNRHDGPGSEFIVRIPAGSVHLPAESIVDAGFYIRDKAVSMSPEPLQPARSAPVRRKKTDFKVVVVDDDEEIRNFLKEELSHIYYVSVYPDGKQALEAVTEKVPDLIISDVSMPVMDGFTFLKRVKNNTSTSHVPVIMLTTKIAQESRIEGFEQGADAYIDKPFNVKELLTVSASLIENRVKMRAKISGIQEQKGVLKPIEMKGNDAALMERIMTCVNRRLCDSDFNVEALADEVGLSRVQLHRRVKEITGITVGEFLRNMRMKQAAELLAKGDVSVSQVTYAVGMSNPTHFTTAFKKYFGVTPTEYLAKHK